MDVETIRERIAEATREEAIYEKMRAHWGTIRQTWSELLQMHESPSKAVQAPLMVGHEQPTIRNRRSGGLSIRMAILQVLKDANGRTLHADEITEGVQALGVTIDAGKYRTPMNLVDFSCYSLRAKHEVRKEGPRLWRWAGGDQPTEQSSTTKANEATTSSKEQEWAFIRPTTSTEIAISGRPSLVGSGNHA